ncbi:MAG: tyrosine-type recombinase/integrase [Thermotogae bacterium]|nr:tyrosine-type recombinase/integrase [Thermotogota bacterium]
MKEVEAIKNPNEINRFRKIMLASNDYLYALLFTYGINTGLRISDILKLKFEDILDERKRVKSSFEVIEQKTEKKRKIIMNDSVREMLELFIKSTDRRTGYIFSRTDGVKPITRGAVWYALNRYAKEAGIKGQIGTHTLRKTFGYQLYKKGIDITRIQYILNHSNPKVTLRYIGITQEEVDDIVENLNI